MATEKRLIDVDAAIERARKSDNIVGSSIWETSEVVMFLGDEPTVDAVEVVRCKDCKHYVWDEFDGCYVCMQLSKYVKPDFWCAYRERK